MVFTIHYSLFVSFLCLIPSLPFYFYTFYLFFPFIHSIFTLPKVTRPYLLVISSFHQFPLRADFFFCLSHFLRITSSPFGSVFLFAFSIRFHAVGPLSSRVVPNLFPITGPLTSRDFSSFFFHLHFQCSIYFSQYRSIFWLLSILPSSYLRIYYIILFSTHSIAKSFPSPSVLASIHTCTPLALPYTFSLLISQKPPQMRQHYSPHFIHS